MVSTCVDSALNELAQLERDSRLPIPMKHQILNLQLDLKFLKMFFWCCANWEDAAKDVLEESNLTTIESALRRAGHSLYASGSIAIHGDRTEKWDRKSSNLLQQIEQFKPDILRICVDLLHRSLECTYSTSQDILEFIAAILKNLKDFLNYKPNIVVSAKNQIRAIEEILGFLRNFLTVTERGIVIYEEEFQVFWNNVQSRVNNAACVIFLFWVDDQMDKRIIFSYLLQKIKPDTLELTGLYLRHFMASKPGELSDTVMTSEVVASLIDFVLQDLPDFVKDILGEGLIILISFLVHPPLETIKGQRLLTEADAVLRNITHLICFIDQTHEDIGELLLVYLIKVEIIKAEVKELYVDISDLSLIDFPKTNGLGFIDFFVENLEEMLEIRKTFIRPFEKKKIARMHKELVCLRCFMKDSFQLQNEEMEIKNLWMRILNVAYKAEHVIDCLIHSSIWYSIICLSDVMQEIKNINTEVKRVQKEQRYKDGVLTAKFNTSHITPALDKVPTSSDGADTVAFNDEANAVLDLLIGGSTDLQVVSIIGMPGIGKTTLANKVYSHRSINLRFHKRAWCSISGAYKISDLLLCILECLDNIDDRIRDMMYEDLAHHLHRCLLGFRYLIVIDDIWGIAPWNELKDSFPSGHEGSRILFTSQNRNVAWETQLPFHLYPLHPLTTDKSWELFQAKLIVDCDLPQSFLTIAEQIAENCAGLPLAIVTVAGLLSRTDKKLDFWRQIAQNTSSFMDREERYQKILELCYIYLPDHLKPFFLYFGAFQEDKAINAQKLIQLCIAEGFVPKMKKVNVEHVAKQYLMDLVARSLLIVTTRGPSGEIKACHMHNLLRRLCLVKVEQESFLKLLHISQFSSNSRKHYQYRLCIYREWLPFVLSRPTGPHVRSLLFSPEDNYLEEHPNDSSFFISFRLLRVLNMESIYLDGSFPIDIILLVHLRYLAVWGKISAVPSSIEKLWNLETFVVKGSKHKTHLPSTIWNMKNLRHLNVRNMSLNMSEIAESAKLSIETFGTLHVSYGEEAKELLRRLPKVRRLRCVLSEGRNSPKDCCQISGLEFPNTLESLNLLHSGRKLNFSGMKCPETLEKLTLSQCGTPWSQISIIGKLPKLQILKLQSGAFVGKSWDIGDDEFPELKFLKLFRLDIEELNTSSYPFPRLKHLVVERCPRLVEIPSILGEIPTLEKIEVHRSKHAAASARELLEEFGHLELLLIDGEKAEDH